MENMYVVMVGRMFAIYLDSFQVYVLDVALVQVQVLSVTFFVSEINQIWNWKVIDYND